jgi:hypothetical protein
MNDFEALQVTMQVTQIITSTEYRKAFLLSRQESVEKLATAQRPSDEYAAIRLLIGTWERIAIACKDFNEGQRRQFFRYHPIALYWRRLEPATLFIRRTTDEAFAAEFEVFRNQYDEWTQSEDGREFRTIERQAICACFA